MQYIYCGMIVITILFPSSIAAEGWREWFAKLIGLHSFFYARGLPEKYPVSKEFGEINFFDYSNRCQKIPTPATIDRLPRNEVNPTAWLELYKNTQLETGITWDQFDGAVNAWNALSEGSSL